MFLLNEQMFWEGRNLKLLGNSAGKQFGDLLSKSKATMLRDWNIQGEGTHGHWQVYQNNSDQNNPSFTTV